MDKVVVDFLHANYVLSISTVTDNQLWSANCFYAFCDSKSALIFISHGNTKHYQMLTENPNVSGTISAQTKNVIHIQGLQYTGCVVSPTGELSKEVNAVYYKRFPFARFVRAKLWLLELSYVKYTDNSLGFGKKICWERK